MNSVQNLMIDWGEILVFAICLHFLSLHLTRKSELRKSCWEIRDSQRFWKSQISVVFALLWDVFFETCACFRRNDVSFWKSNGSFAWFCRKFFKFLPLELCFLPLEFLFLPLEFWKSPTKLSENAQSLKWTSRKCQNGEGKSVFWFPRMKKNRAIFDVWH